MSDALALQVGGTHYKTMAIQPVEFALVNELNTAQANIIKYLCRHLSKDGARDLKKAIHYCDLWLDVFLANEMPWGRVGIEWRPGAGIEYGISVAEFVAANGLPSAAAQVVTLICEAPTRARVKTARAVLVGLLMKHYGEAA